MPKARARPKSASLSELVVLSISTAPSSSSSSSSDDDEEQPIVSIGQWMDGLARARGCATTRTPPDARGRGRGAGARTILRLEVAVQHAVLVTVRSALQDLLQVGLPTAAAGVGVGRPNSAVATAARTLTTMGSPARPGCWSMYFLRSRSSSLRREISRIAVEGTPSSSCSRRIFFSAIVLSVLRSRALYTTPYVPSPIFSTFSYCAASAPRTHKRASEVSGTFARGSRSEQPQRPPAPSQLAGARVVQGLLHGAGHATPHRRHRAAAAAAAAATRGSHLLTPRRPRWEGGGGVGHANRRLSSSRSGRARACRDWRGGASRERALVPTATRMRQGPAGRRTHVRRGDGGGWRGRRGGALEGGGGPGDIGGAAAAT
eukprot:scaffold1630_cov298-Prasinococcus_capsulatus_cf.AAC.2